jgi:hypothetical protein
MQSYSFLCDLYRLIIAWQVTQPSRGRQQKTNAPPEADLTFRYESVLEPGPPVLCIAMLITAVLTLLKKNMNRSWFAGGGSL